MKRILVLMLMLAPVSVQAQEVNIEAVKNCFGSAGIADTMPYCLGQASNACQQQGFSSTMGIVQCIQAETKVWDDLLNEEYSAVRAMFKVRSAGGINLGEKLLQAQRAWIAYRDAECELSYARWQEGSIRSVVFANCMMVMTAGRAIELRDMKGN